MPFSFTWTNTDPADPTAANLLGKDIRDLRSAIQERMDANFCDPSGPWLTSDPTHPIVPAAPILGNAAKSVNIHHSDFEPDLSWFSSSGIFGGGSQSSTLTRSQQYSQVTNYSASGGSPTSRTLFAPIRLPGAAINNGVSITSIGFLLDIQTVNCTMSCKAGWMDFVTGAVTVLGTVNAPNTIGPNNVVLNTGFPFSTGPQGGHAIIMFMEVDVTIPGFNAGTPRLYGANVNYSTVDCRSSL